MKFYFPVVTPLSRLLANSTRTYSNASIISSSILQNTFFLNPDEKLINSVLVKPSNIGLNIGIIGNHNWKKEIFEIPLTNKIVENPNQITKIIEDVTKIEKTVDLPAINGNKNDDVGKQAARLIVIRRRKMKKHKLKKLRKKMKFMWAKVKPYLKYLLFYP